MSRKKQDEKALVAVEPEEVEVLPPQAGVMGDFLTETVNMFRARGMRMKAQLSRINDTGQRMEKMLRIAAETIEAAEEKLGDDLRKQGLLPGISPETDEDEE